MNEFDQFLKELYDNLLSKHVVPTPREADAICLAARDLFLYSGWVIREMA